MLDYFYNKIVNNTSSLWVEIHSEGIRPIAEKLTSISSNISSHPRYSKEYLGWDVDDYIFNLRVINLPAIKMNCWQHAILHKMNLRNINNGTSFLIRGKGYHSSLITDIISSILFYINSCIKSYIMLAVFNYTKFRFNLS